jgi:hypothetical protein
MMKGLGKSIAVLLTWPMLVLNSLMATAGMCQMDTCSVEMLCCCVIEPGDGNSDYLTEMASSCPCYSMNKSNFDSDVTLLPEKIGNTGKRTAQPVANDVSHLNLKNDISQHQYINVYGKNTISSINIYELLASYLI